ncbi:MAG TPA: hypothetical protein VE974_08275 [Thermoanaerobaculia bacterium]|nr:hypothetical protein [Thermoanaerobaculia bacterium]
MAVSSKETNLNAPSEQAVKAALAAPAKPAISNPQRCCVRQYWAVIERNGKIVRGRNVVSAQRLATGQYEVIFNDNMTNGVYQATIGRPGIATEPAGEIGVALRFGNNNGVWIDTHDSAGNFSDRAFHVIAFTD